MKYTENFFSAVKVEHFVGKNDDIFNIHAQNIDCGYTLEPPRRGGSNEYPQYIFWMKKKKNRYTPAYPQSMFWMKIKKNRYTPAYNSFAI